MVEIKARFDEQNNMKCAQELEKAGVHVMYGPPGNGSKVGCVTVAVPLRDMP